MPSRFASAAIRRLGFSMILLAAVLVGPAGRPQPSAADEADDEAAFIDAINELRDELGLEELVPHPELTELARRHAEAMAAQGDIFHADPISAGLQADWRKLGENVGVGASVQVLMDAFVASPGHYANLLDPSFTDVGVGVVWVGDILYTTHRFMQRPGAGDDDIAPAEPPPASSTAPDPSANRSGPEAVRPALSPQRVQALFALLDAG